MSVRNDAARAELSAHLGIAPDEAGLYLHLVLSGPSKAGDVAEALHLHRSEVYRSMERLAGRGLVRIAQERPALYAAVELERLLDEELRQRLAAIEALRSTRTEIEGLLRAVSGEPVKSTYKVLRGRREIYRARSLLIRGARSTLDWATTFAPALRLWEESGELALVRRRAAEGIRFRALLPACPELDDAIRYFDELGSAELRRFAPAGTVRFLVADERELLIFVVNDPTIALDAEDEVAIHTTAPGFVYAQQAFFEQCWRGIRAPAPAVEARDHALMASFAGPLRGERPDAPRP